MKTFLLSILSVVMAVVFVSLGAMGAVVVYETRPEPTSQPAQVIEQPVYLDRDVTVIVPEVVVVQATAMPVVEMPQPAQVIGPVVDYPPPPTETTPVERCTNIARIVSQPRSDLQGDALNIGTIKRLKFALSNEGTCPWRDYRLVSDGAFPDMAIPYTPPGGVAEFQYEFKAERSLEARFVLQAPDGYLFGVVNSPSPGVGVEPIYYRLDVLAERNVIQIPPELGGGTMCVGPG